MTRLLNFLYWAGMSVIGVTVAAMIAIGVGDFWVRVVPEVLRAITGG